MPTTLPQFAPRNYASILEFAQIIFTNHQSDEIWLHELIAYKDHHYRAIFKPQYFILPSPTAEPSKSQWNSLKKKFKRHDRQAFVFKDYGKTETHLYYIEFGFFES